MPLFSPGRALCHECNAREKAAAVGKYICYKCHAIIDEGAPLKYRVIIQNIGLIFYLDSYSLLIITTLRSFYFTKHCFSFLPRMSHTIHIILTVQPVE